MKKTNKGKEDLIPRSEWVEECEIQGTDEMVLYHPIMRKAFFEILKKYKPKKSIAFVSLCTSTRPYSKSRKWKKFKEEFGKDCDLIIASNGGIIPIEFEECYPFLTYDAHGQKQYDELYIKFLYSRLMKFFNKFHYDYIIFNFRPNMRNRVSANAFVKHFKGNTKCFIAPSNATYEKARRNKFKPYGSRYPDLSDEVMQELRTIIKEVKNKNE